MTLPVTLLWSMRLDGTEITPHGVYSNPATAAYDLAREQAADPTRQFAVLTLPLFAEEVPACPQP